MATHICPFDGTPFKNGRIHARSSAHLSAAVAKMHKHYYTVLLNNAKYSNDYIENWRETLDFLERNLYIAQRNLHHGLGYNRVCFCECVPMACCCATCYPLPKDEQRPWCGRCCEHCPCIRKQKYDN